MPSHNTVVYRLMVLGVLGALLLPLLPPMLFETGHGDAATSLRLLFRPVCHQLPERSLYFQGYPLAICARCLGIYAGFLAGLLLLPRFSFLAARLLRRPRLLLLSAAPMFIDALFWGNSAVVRTASGFLAAFPVALFVWVGMDQLLDWRQT